MSDIRRKAETRYFLGNTQGPTGGSGDTGSIGPAGPGVPDGGTPNQVLIKSSSTNQDTEWATPCVTGIYDYNDLTTATTPISLDENDGFVSLTNDGAGSLTNLSYGVPGVTNLWNTITNQLDFSGLSIGDSIDLRVDVEVTTSSPNQEVIIDLFLGTGAGEYQLNLIDIVEKNSGLHKIDTWNGIYIGDTNTKDNPAYIKIASDDGLTVKINGWYIRASLRNPVYI